VECLIFIESSGKFDLKPVEAAKAPAKKYRPTDLAPSPAHSRR
jgi:hypothetical protein